MQRRPDARGSVLVMALLVALLILGLGLLVLWVGSSRWKVSSDISRHQEALYAAEAGIDRARAALTAAPSSWQPFIDGCGAARDDLPGKGAVFCTAAAAPLQDEPVVRTASATAARAMTYTVWIRNDAASECDQLSNGAFDCDGDGAADANPALARQDHNRRVILRSEGMARDGTSVVLEVAITGSLGGAPRVEFWREAR